MLDMVMMTMTGGRQRTETEWRWLLADGGFRLDRVVSPPGMFSAIEATVN